MTATAASFFDTVAKCAREEADMERKRYELILNAIVTERDDVYLYGIRGRLTFVPSERAEEWAELKTKLAKAVTQ